MRALAPSAAVAATAARHYPRFADAIVELCCEEDSELCRLADSTYGLKAMRITKAQRFHTDDGLHRAMTFVHENASAGLAVDAWASLPCTPWTTWTFLNESRLGPRYRSRLGYQRRLSIRMVGHAEKVLAAAASSAGAGHFEWPRHCRGWQRRRVRDMISRLSLVTADCDGCSFGVEVSPGVLALKKWRIVTARPATARSLAAQRCSGDHVHGILFGKAAFRNPRSG